MTFGAFLKKLREEKQFKIRELGRLAKLDPAYIYRLEEGEKSSPSDEVLRNLIRSLKLDERRERILRLLTQQSDVDDQLINLVLKKETILIEDFESAAKASFRENRPQTEEQWEKYLQKIKEAREAI